VYQAYLDPHNYHRWHSPVTGTVRAPFVQPGTYYSEAESEGEDPAGPNKSQGYLAHVATGSIVLIESDDRAIGQVGLIFVGMGEVSSCLIHPDLREGRRVTKADEVGYFQYGGSSYCLIFRPGSLSGFSVLALPQPDRPDPSLVLMGTKLATASE
jgi:phosphatidylserine decarboxylase